MKTTYKKAPWFIQGAITLQIDIFRCELNTLIDTDGV